jgi:translation elongation factor EF-G
MSGKQQIIKAQVPMSERLNYQSILNSITAARGSFHMQFSPYDSVRASCPKRLWSSRVLRKESKAALLRHDQIKKL